ncbi:short-subunit dehydrogenase [Microbacterium terrae]|uniref:Oxidoreductase n=1 Tax=Microbacterium terrae TaxID=69369 RepID=A0A0M2GWV7_9MICO|nr:SDR family oxidoreductase [Microbacterium terrae]KJL38055.1 putative oxidoreductase [Microbacterium terrae]MBP1077467.1 short-subunit dehydrogenase [Microbacterium terrae]GLJ99073.1 short chain dehydrogenase [Microbacterium terrae]
MATHLITGGGSGIGAALAGMLAERGDELWLLARDAGRAAQLRDSFPGARTLVGDLAEPSRLSWAFSHQSVPPQLDSLIHVAGVVELGPVADTPVATWQHQLNVNAVSPAELTRLLAPALRTARGHVVFVNSGAGLRVSAEWGSYAASKFAVRAIADALREEERQHGVRVTTVYPGRTATPMQEKVHQQEGAAYDASRWIDPASVATAIIAALDLPRDAEITELTVRPGA